MALTAIAVRFRVLFVRQAKLLVLVLYSLVMCCLAVVRVPASAGNQGAVGLDTSWVIALAATLQQGEISGRDFNFTHGVLSQALAGLGLVLNTSGSAFDAYPAIILTYWVTNIILMVFLWYGIRQIDWKHTLFMGTTVAVLIIPFDPLAFRYLLLLICALLLYYCMSAGTNRSRTAWAALVGGMCFAAQLITLELGIYAVTASCIVLGAYALFAYFPSLIKRKDLWLSRSYLYALGVVLCTFALGNILISVVFKLTSADYGSLFDYQRYALQILHGHVNTMGTAWSLSWVSTGILGAVIAYVIGYIGFHLRRFRTADGYLLFSMMVFALVPMRSAMLRSDVGHIVEATNPVVLLFLIVGKDWLNNTGSVRFVWAVCLVALVAIWPYPDLSPLAQVRLVAEGKISISEHLKHIVTLQTPPGEVVPVGIDQALSDPTRPMSNFPYEDYIAIALRRRMVAPTVQAYIANTEALQQKYVETLERQADNLDLTYGLDDVVSAAIDDVQQVTRVPIIFEYLYRNYELKSRQAYGGGFYLLQRRSQPVDLKGEVLAFSSNNDDSNLMLGLNKAANCSMVRLGITIAYPLMSLFGRPNALHASFLMDGQELHRSDVVAIETGQEFTTYISLMDPDKFYQVFDPNGAQSRQWDALHLWPRSTGLFGVSPDMVEIKHVDCINF